MYVPRDGDYPFDREGGGEGFRAKGANGLEENLGQQARFDKAAFEGVGGAS